MPRRHGMSNLRCDAPEREWRIVTYCGNHSRFGHPGFKPSTFSEVRCTRCGTRWRTRAAYLARLAHDKGSP